MVIGWFVASTGSFAGALIFVTGATALMERGHLRVYAGSDRAHRAGRDMSSAILHSNATVSLSGTLDAKLQPIAQAGFGGVEIF